MLIKDDLALFNDHVYAKRKIVKRCKNKHHKKKGRENKKKHCYVTNNGLMPCNSNN